MHLLQQAEPNPLHSSNYSQANGNPFLGLTQPAPFYVRFVHRLRNRFLFASRAPTRRTHFEATAVGRAGAATLVFDGRNHGAVGITDQIARVLGTVAIHVAAAIVPEGDLMVAPGTEEVGEDIGDFGDGADELLWGRDG